LVCGVFLTHRQTDCMSNRQTGKLAKKCLSTRQADKWKGMQANRQMESWTASSHADMNTGRQADTRTDGWTSRWQTQIDRLAHRETKHELLHHARMNAASTKLRKAVETPEEHL